MVSVIIPVLNEAPNLSARLTALVPQAVEIGAEIILVDGGSADGSRELAGKVGGIRLLDASAGRGIQMNAGARAARGSLLVFLPADTRLPPGAVRLLGEIDRAGRPEAGGFRQRFDADRLFLRLVSFLHNLRAALTGVFYGDQVPFVRRELFVELGGYREARGMEDVEFGTRLRRRVRPRQLRPVVHTSARRFDRHGDLRTVAEATRLLFWWTFFRRIPDSSIFFDPARAAGPDHDAAARTPARATPGPGRPDAG